MSKISSVLLLVTFFYIISGFVMADDQTYILEEITVTGTRGERDNFGTPAAVSIITSQEIGKRSLGTTPDMLRGITGVMVQKTTSGQGSPYVRGLTGYQILIIVDGVRLNNSTFRSGPNQYLATIDTGQIQKIEVMRGYGSTLYGSSAIGGVINVFTKPPVDSLKGFSIHPWISTKYSSSDTGKYGRIGMDGGYKNLTFTGGFSYKDIGDLKPGKGYDVQLPTKKFLLTSESEPRNIPKDAWLVDVEKPTGWKEKNGDLKLNYSISSGQNLKLAYQGTRQENVPRYDRYATKEYDILLYNPQNRDLTYLNYTAKDLIPFASYIQASVSYHKQEEGQKQQKAKSTSQTQINDEVSTIGLSLQLDSKLKGQKITYGGEFYHDELDSQSFTTDLKTNKVKEEAWGAYPDGAVFWDMNAYIQDELKILDNLDVILAGRYTRFQTQADLSIKDPSFGMFENSGNALTGSFGLVYGITDSVNLTFTAGQAFRAPSLSDTTAVKITNQAISAPNPDLKPERSSGIDLGVKTRTRYFSGTINYYFNRIKDSVTNISVQDAYSGKEMPKIYQDLISANKDAKITIAYNSQESTHIQGIEIALLKAVFPFLTSLSTYGNLTITRVKDEAENRPMQREMPVNGILGIMWEENKGRFWVETYTRFAAKQDRLASADRSDPRIPGTTNDPNKEDLRAYTPGWFTLNFRTGFRINDWNRLSLGVENIADRRYREHGSGVDGPGRNFFAGVDYRF